MLYEQCIAGDLLFDTGRVCRVQRLVPYLTGKLILTCETCLLFFCLFVFLLEYCIDLKFVII